MDRSGLRNTLQQLSSVVGPPGARDRTDGELLHAYCAQRDEAAFAALVQRHSRLVLSVCQRVLRQREDHEDVFQATFLALARDAAAVRQRESIAGWLHGVARHIALDARRAAGRRHHHEEQAMTKATPDPAWQAAWHEVQTLLDQAIQRLPNRYREPFVLCCLENLSRAEAATRLGIKQGTVGSRLTEARRRLRERLARRGVALSAVLAATAVAAGAAHANEPAKLAATVTRIATQLAGGGALTPDLVSHRILALVQGVPKAMFSTTRIIALLLAIGLVSAGGGLTAVAYYRSAAGAQEPPRQAAQTAVVNLQPAPAKGEATVWKEVGMVRTPGWLLWSAAYAANGKMLVLGGTGGHVRAIDPGTRKDLWQADVGGDHAALAFTPNGRSIAVTFGDGVRLLDAATGKPGTVLEEKNSNPTAVAVLQDPLAASRQLRLNRIVFANRQSYFVKLWLDSAAPSTITLSTSAKENKGADAYAVPLAVDPEGRSAIVTGPIDRATGKNILWAWSAGDREPGSPGNRLLKGHDAVVIAAAWSRNGKTAVTGDASGRVIVWDAQAMREVHRVEMGERAAALALAPDGTKLAAVAIGKQASFYAWDSTAPKKLQPIQVDAGDYSGPVHACLAFSPDGRQLVGGAINTDWLNRLGVLIGTLHVWNAEQTKSEK